MEYTWLAQANFGAALGYGLLSLLYLSTGYLSVKFIVMDFNDSRDSSELPWWRVVLRMLVFPVASLDWEKREDPARELPTLVSIEGSNDSNLNEAYIIAHTFFWPLLRALPFAVGSLFASVYFAGVTIYFGIKALIYPFNFLFGNLFSFKKKVSDERGNYLKAFQQEIAASKVKIEGIRDSRKANIDRLRAAIHEAGVIQSEQLSSRVQVLMGHLAQLLEREKNNFSAAEAVIGKIEEAHTQLADHDRLITLYRKMADLTGRYDEESELFQRVRDTVESIREASLMLSDETSHTEVLSEVTADTDEVAEERKRFLSKMNQKVSS